MRSSSGLLDRGRERREQRDDRGADHQRRGSTGGALRVAHRVAPGELAGLAAEHPDRDPDQCRCQPRDDRSDQHGADDGEQRAEPGHRHRRVGIVRRRDDERHAAGRHQRAEHGAHDRGAGAIDLDVAECRQRRDATGLDRRRQAGDQGDDHADRPSTTITVVLSSARAAVGIPMPSAPEQRMQPVGQQQAA